MIASIKLYTCLLGRAEVLGIRRASSLELYLTFAEILQRFGCESAWAVQGTTGDGHSVDEDSLNTRKLSNNCLLLLKSPI